MARYTGPTFKKSRRYGFSVLENGKEFAKGKQREYVPGQHGPTARIKLSEYGLHLNEKQKIKFMYGISEKQMKRTFQQASKRKGVSGTNFLPLASINSAGYCIPVLALKIISPVSLPSRSVAFLYG